jgi:hypothetical protein
MATATRERKKAKRQPPADQKELTDGNGTPLAGERIKELEDLGMELDRVRKERMELNLEEDQLQTKCLSAMEAHGIVTAYKLRDGRFLTKEHEEKDKVKIKDPAGKEKKKGRKKGTGADFGDN